MNFKFFPIFFLFFEAFYSLRQLLCHFCHELYASKLIFQLQNNFYMIYLYMINPIFQHLNENSLFLKLHLFNGWVFSYCSCIKWCLISLLTPLAVCSFASQNILSRPLTIMNEKTKTWREVGHWLYRDYRRLILFIVINKTTSPWLVDWDSRNPLIVRLSRANSIVFVW